MKTSLHLIVATLLLLAGTVLAQTKATPPAPPAPGAPLTKEQMEEMIRQKLEEARKNFKSTNAAAAATNVPARRIAPTPLPPAPGAPPALAAPKTQTPPSPMAPPAPPTVQAPVPPSPGAPAVPAAQVKPVSDANAPAAKSGKETLLPAGFLKLVNMDLFQALDLYADLVKRTVLRPTSLPATQISLKSQTELTTAEAIQALDSVFALNGITTILVGEKFVTVVPSAQAMQEGAAFTSKLGADLPEAAQYTTQIIQLKHVAPSEVQQVITPFAKNPGGIVAIDSSQTLVLRDYAINVKRMMEVIEKIDVPVPPTAEMELIPIKYALVTDIAAVLGSLTSGGAMAAPTSSTSARRSGSSGGRRGGSSGRGGSPTGYGSPTGQPGLNPMGRTPTTPGAPAPTASGAVNSFQDRLRSIVQRAASGGDAPLLGDAKIIPDERTNSLLIFATKEEREMIKKIIEQLDKVQAQVLIEAIIVEVTLSDSLSAGVSMSQNNHRANRFNGAIGSQQSSAFPFSFIDPKNVNSLTNFPGGFNYFGSVGRDFDFVVAAAAADSRVNILSRPRIQTSHAVEAELFDGETRPFPTGTYQTYGGLNQTQTSQQQIGIRLNILPLINVDGLVVLDIAQTVQSLGANIQIDANFSVPSVIDRQASSRVAVKDGDTIILGGMIRNEKRNSQGGVPYLKDIPLLGKLFSSKATEDTKRELIVFIRPTVLPTPDIAASYATEETDKLIDVKQAQYEMMRDEEKRRLKMEQDLRKQKENEQRQPRK